MSDRKGKTRYQAYIDEEISNKFKMYLKNNNITFTEWLKWKIEENNKIYEFYKKIGVINDT